MPACVKFTVGLLLLLSPYAFHCHDSYYVGNSPRMHHSACLDNRAFNFLRLFPLKLAISPFFSSSRKDAINLHHQCLWPHPCTNSSTMSGTNGRNDGYSAVEVNRDGQDFRILMVFIVLDFKQRVFSVCYKFNFFMFMNKDMF